MCHSFIDQKSGDNMPKLVLCLKSFMEKNEVYARLPCRGKWQPTPVFLPGKSHGQRNLVGYSSWDRRVGHDWATSLIIFFWTSLVAQRVKHLPVMQETWVQSLGQEDPLEKEAATHSCFLAWRIPWTEEPHELYSPWDCKVPDMMERLTLSTSFSWFACLCWVITVAHRILFVPCEIFPSGGQSIGASASASVLQWIFRTDFLKDWLVWSPCSPTDSQESSPTSQFKSITSSALSFLYGPTLASIHD